jgi:hypothetical protein
MLKLYELKKKIESLLGMEHPRCPWEDDEHETCDSQWKSKTLLFSWDRVDPMLFSTNTGQ